MAAVAPQPPPKPLGHPASTTSLTLTVPSATTRTTHTTSNHPPLTPRTSALLADDSTPISERVTSHDIVVIAEIRINHRDPPTCLGWRVICCPARGSSWFVCDIDDEIRSIIILLLIGLVIALFGLYIAYLTGRIHLSTILSWTSADQAYVLGTLSLCILSCLLVGLQIFYHMKYYTHPPAQRHMIRVLFIVPVYSVTSWVSFAYPGSSMYLDFIRSCWESVALYEFLLLLTKFLGGHAGVTNSFAGREPIDWLSPLNCCLSKFVPTSSFLWKLKYGTLQYVFCTPVLSAVAMILYSIDSCGTSGQHQYDNCYDGHADGVSTWLYGYYYIIFFWNLHASTALYCLVWFYVVCHDELAPFHPFAKFMSIKLIVFFTFWQSILLSFLVSFGVITDDTLPGWGHSASDVATRFNNFVVCLEMFGFACVFKYAFPYEDYRDGKMGEMIDELCRENLVRAQQLERAAAGESALEDGDNKALAGGVIVAEPAPIIAESQRLVSSEPTYESTYGSTPPPDPSPTAFRKKLASFRQQMMHSMQS